MLGGIARAEQRYGDAARAATNAAERDHLTRQAARLHTVLRAQEDDGGAPPR
jgi:hypothetical protein